MAVLKQPDIKTSYHQAGKMNESKKPFILVVVGDSASGKTTLLGNLRRTKCLRSWVTIRDMDENGCPYPGREHWRKYRVEELLANSIADYREGRGAVMGGWIWPHEVIASPFFDFELNLHFLFLKNSEAEYRRRLRPRVGTRMTKGEFESWADNFPDQQRRLENQVRFTARHSVLETWKLTRSEVTKETLKLIFTISA